MKSVYMILMISIGNVCVMGQGIQGIIPIEGTELGLAVPLSPYPGAIMLAPPSTAQQT